MHRNVIRWAGLLLLCLLAAHAYGGYGFTPMVMLQNGMSMDMDGDDYVLTNTGQLFFTAYDDSTWYRNLYRSDGQGTQLLVPGGVFGLGWGGKGFDANDDGTLVFTSYPRSDYEETTTTIYEVTGGRTFRALVSPSNSGLDYVRGVSINNAGVIAFAGGVYEGDVYDGHTAWGLYSQAPGAPMQSLLAADSSPFSGFGSVSLNAAGKVAFVAEDPDMGESQAMGTTSGDDTFTIYQWRDPDDYTSLRTDPPALNNAGQLAHVVRAPNDLGYTETHLMLSDDASSAELLSLVDPWGGDGGITRPSLNDSGQVAFKASYNVLDDQQNTIEKVGIYAGADLAKSKVIEVGDLLWGYTVQSLAFSTRGLNNSGQIAFWAELSNPNTGAWTQAILLADPSGNGGGGFAPGDMNFDGLVNPLDIQPFILALLHPELNKDPGLMAVGDFDLDGVIGTLDIAPFVSALVSGSSGPVIVPEPAAAAILVAGLCLLRRR